MFCPNCGMENDDNNYNCARCGSLLHQAGGPGDIKAQPSTKAILSLVFGILGLTCMCILTGIPAIILGFLARKEIRESKGQKTGNGMAIAGIAMGFISTVIIPLLLVAISVPNFLEAQERSKVSRAKSDLRSMATGLEAYYVDNSVYPMCATGEQGANGFLSAGDPAFQVPTFRVWSSSNEVRIPQKSPNRFSELV